MSFENAESPRPIPVLADLLAGWLNQPQQFAMDFIETLPDKITPRLGLPFAECRKNLLPVMKDPVWRRIYRICGGVGSEYHTSTVMTSLRSGPVSGKVLPHSIWGELKGTHFR